VDGVAEVQVYSIRPSVSLQALQLLDSNVRSLKANAILDIRENSFMERRCASQSGIEPMEIVGSCIKDQYAYLSSK
jgi:hypothetical protein